jgi:uncharacterized protein
MANPFVHLELNTPDLEKAKAFYGELFGWEFNDTPMPEGIYSTFKPSDGPGGGITSMGEGTAWLAYVGVDDIKAATAKAESLGAKVLMGNVEIPQVGWMTIMVDPTGARIAMFQPPKS